VNTQAFMPMRSWLYGLLMALFFRGKGKNYNPGDSPGLMKSFYNSRSFATGPLGEK